MYQREWQLLTQIDNLTKAVEHLKKCGNLPLCKQPESKVEKREEEVQEFPAARSFGMPLRQVALARNRP